MKIFFTFENISNSMNTMLGLRSPFCLTFLPLFVLSFWSCDNKNKNDDKGGQNDLNINFYTACDSFDVGIGGFHTIGGYAFPMAYCYTNHDYDLIWKPKKRAFDIKYSNKMSLKDPVSDTFYKEFETKEFNNFIGYAFVLPKKQPENPENEFDVFDYAFPCKVKAYKHNKNWKFIKSKEVASLKELGRFKKEIVVN